MTIAGSIILALLMFLPASQIPFLGEDVFNPKEKDNLAAANSLDGRIKVYEAASRRIHKMLRETARQEKSDAVPDILKTWVSLLTGSSEDIVANSKSKKKSKKLIKYEIQVRKAINALHDLKAKAPTEQQDAYDACMDQAETIRKRFIDILFRP